MSRWSRPTVGLLELSSSRTVATLSMYNVTTAVAKAGRSVRRVVTLAPRATFDQGGAASRLLARAMGGISSKQRIDKALGASFPESERVYGLENFGNTCYCNSVLQALYYCKPLREVRERAA